MVTIDGALTGDSPCEKAGPPASEGQILDSKGHFHRGPYPQTPINESTRLTLEAQQVQARAVAAKFPTVASAVAAGYRESTVYVPCIGAHYTNAALAVISTRVRLRSCSTTARARLAHRRPELPRVHQPAHPARGLRGPERPVAPAHLQRRTLHRPGRARDRRREHVGGRLRRAGGHKAPLANVWMVHDWVVPGFECSWGVFAGGVPRARRPRRRDRRSTSRTPRAFLEGDRQGEAEEERLLHLTRRASRSGPELGEHRGNISHALHAHQWLHPS